MSATPSLQPISFFSILRGLPLFQGLGTEDFAHIVGQLPFSFLKQAEGTMIVQQDSACDKLVFVLHGTVKIVRHSLDRGYSMEEKNMKSPNVIQPEALLGLYTHYGYSCIAQTDVQLMVADKKVVMQLLSQYEVFRINFLNYVCRKAQSAENLLFRTIPATLDKRFAAFIMQRVRYPAGHKTLRIDMIRLAAELDTTRRNVSTMLHSLAEKKLIITERKRIEIPKLEDFNTL